MKGALRSIGKIHLAEREVGARRVIEAPRLMGAEDFSYFAERVPACFFTVGSNGGPETAWPHHHARFDLDERALATGVVDLAEDELQDRRLRERRPSRDEP